MNESKSEVSQRYDLDGGLKPFQKEYLDKVHDDAVRFIKYGGRGMSKSFLLDGIFRKRARELGLLGVPAIECHHFPNSDRFVILDDLIKENSCITSIHQKETIPIKGGECPPSETKRKQLRAKRKKKGKRRG